MICIFSSQAPRLCKIIFAWLRDFVVNSLYKPVYSYPGFSIELSSSAMVKVCMSSQHNNPLVFVYNADSGLFNTMTDIAHKMFSPSTYSCNLCAITHGLLAEKQEWREFIEQLDMPVEFLHRDEFEGRYHDALDSYPAVLQHNGADFDVLLSASDINRCDSIAALRQMIHSVIKRSS